MANTYSSQQIVVGNTTDFQLLAAKNGVAWDISGGTVTLYLKKPDGTLLTKGATLTSPTTGQADYICLTTDLDQDGDWVKQWKVVAGGLTMWTDEETFTVESNLTQS